MELQDIKKLIEMIEKSPITEFELVDKELKIRISKNGVANSAVHMMPAPAMTVAAPAAPVAAAPAAPVAAPPADSKRQLHEIKSPMVGTFYRAPSPDAEPYVRMGDTVEPGKVICIVEAMKLMNELESEVRGRIVEIVVENAQPVEFGQILFRVDTSVA
ncbi:MAG TPA: acetyl-CoA carboxylase biotin carboxyl carrier protein [bacterium]